MWWLASVRSSVSVPCGRTCSDLVALILNCIIRAKLGFTSLSQYTSAHKHLCPNQTVYSSSLKLSAALYLVFGDNISKPASQLLIQYRVQIYHRQCHTVVLQTNKTQKQVHQWCVLGGLMCACIYMYLYVTWISALSIAPNISMFLSVLDGFCKSNLRL